MTMMMTIYMNFQKVENIGYGAEIQLKKRVLGDFPIVLVQNVR